jgi:multidrug efflux pump subunit AcrA (membrane-fusion protein)
MSLFAPSTPEVPQPTSDPNATQRDINTRLVAAQSDYQAAQAAYNADPSVANRAALFDAAEKLRQIRAVPMRSLAPFAGKRYAALDEGGM